MPSRLITVTLLFLGLAAPANGRAAQPLFEIPDSVADAVYSSLIAQHYDRGDPSPLIILGESVNGPDDAVVDEHYRLMLQSALSPLTAETAASFEGISSAPRTLKAQLKVRRAYLLLSRGKRDSLFAVCPGGWDRFAEHYPHARGYITLSPVAHDSEQTQALVYTEDHCGMGCGEGVYVFLQRVGASWKVMKKLTAWVQ